MDMSVRASFEEWLGLQGDLSPVEVMRVECALALANEIDFAQIPDEQGRTRPASPAAARFVAIVDDLVRMRERAVKDADAGDWSRPGVPSIAAVRDAKKPKPRNVRSRAGNGGGKAG